MDGGGVDGGEGEADPGHPVGGGFEDQSSGGVGALVAGGRGFWGFESGAEPSGTLAEPAEWHSAG
ncbi:hypothetical protein GCM10009857_35450 [Agromyces soli]